MLRVGTSRAPYRIYPVEKFNGEHHITRMPQQFGTFTASELYCPKCKSSQPVRERLLLVLPSGELHEFLCSRCAMSLGKRTVTGPAVTTGPFPGRGRGKSDSKQR
jgi:hypothetical protein